MTLQEIIKEIKKQLKDEIVYDVWKSDKQTFTSTRIKGIEGVALADVAFTPVGYTDDEGYITEYHNICAEIINIYDNYDNVICSIYDVDLLD